MMGRPREGTAVTTLPSLPRAAVAGDLDAGLARLRGGPAGAWQRGWILTARGSYDDALAALGEAARGPRIIRAAAHATRAALLRQVRLHASAADEDRAGLAALDGVDAPEAAAALSIGVVADAVGLGLATEELQGRLRAARQRAAAARAWRQDVRLAWVEGEVALVAGEGEHARSAFAQAVWLSERFGARRHEAKSALFCAAAHCALGDLRCARLLAQHGLELATTCGAVPLRWPALRILGDIALRAGDRAEGVRLHGDANTVFARLVATLPPPLARAALDDGRGGQARVP